LPLHEVNTWHDQKSLVERNDFSPLTACPFPFRRHAICRCVAGIADDLYVTLTTLLIVFISTETDSL
jgi:hypothetical protein